MTKSTVVHAPDENRWEVRVDGRLAGFTEYVIRKDRFVFHHTEIDGAFDGQGLGSTLARIALDEVRSMGRSLVPLCPFIRAWIERHPDYDDLVDHDLLSHYDERQSKREAEGQ